MRTLNELDSNPIVRTALDLAEGQDSSEKARSVYSALREHNEALDKQLQARGLHPTGADKALALPSEPTSAAGLAILQTLILAAERKEKRLTKIIEQSAAA